MEDGVNVTITLSYGPFEDRVAAEHFVQSVFDALDAGYAAPAHKTVDIYPETGPVS